MHANIVITDRPQMSGPNTKVHLVVLPAYFRCQENNLYCLCCHCHNWEYRLYLQKKTLESIIHFKMSLVKTGFTSTASKEGTTKVKGPLRQKITTLEIVRICKYL